MKNILDKQKVHTDTALNLLKEDIRISIIDTLRQGFTVKNEKDYKTLQLLIEILDENKSIPP